MRVSILRSAAAALLFLLANAVLIPAYALCLGPARGWRRPIQILWCHIVCKLAGLRVRIIGTPSTTSPMLYVSNHVSYLDIAVLSRYLDGAYVAKGEVAQWPLFGMIARLTGTIFVSRRVTEARAHRQQVRARLTAGSNLLIFPEGTSTDGSGVAPFKAALFDIIDISISEIPLSEIPVHVQPISIAYTRAVDGTPLIGPNRALYCWYGDRTLIPHLLRMLGLPGAEVALHFHSAVRAAHFPNRKALARHCQQQVAAGIAHAHHQAHSRPEPVREWQG